jgi:hypothetical protein
MRRLRRRIAPPEQKSEAVLGLKRGGPCRDRTYDLGIKSPLLYQLS